MCNGDKKVLMSFLKKVIEELAALLDVAFSSVASVINYLGNGNRMFILYARKPTYQRQNLQ